MPKIQLVEFSFSDLAIAGDMSKRAVQHIAEARPRLLPAGRGIEILKRIAVIGAFMSGGVPLIAAGRIASAILDEFNQYDGEVPSGLNFMARDVRQEKIPEDNDYWYHQALWKHPEIYKPGQVVKSDALIEIVDRTHLFIRSASGIRTMNPWGGEPEEADYIGRIVGRIEDWDRGANPVVVTVPELVPLDWQAPEFKEEGLKLCEMARTVRANAVSILMINVSLAVRNGLDRLARKNTED